MVRFVVSTRYQDLEHRSRRRRQPKPHVRAFIVVSRTLHAPAGVPCHAGGRGRRATGVIIPEPQVTK